MLKPDINATDCGCLYLNASYGMLIFRVCISSRKYEINIDTFMHKHFPWLRQELDTPVIVFGEFNLDVVKDDKDWWRAFVLYNFRLARCNDPNQQTTPWCRSCLDLALATKRLPLPLLKSNKSLYMPTGRCSDFVTSSMDIPIYRVGIVHQLVLP